ncbi:MAG: hypothetical protein KA764_10130 [Anaerolineales bacterium]|nr:hypothetical protein [Anaerolineales bacterium]
MSPHGLLPAELVLKAKSVDLLALVQPHTQLRRLSTMNGGELCGPCPLCGGKKRFHVLPGRGRWFCRHCTPRWEDAIGFYQRVTGVNFQAAVQALAEGTQPVVRAHEWAADFDLPPALAWQERAGQIIWAAQETLWSKTGAAARDWLKRRGLSEATIAHWRLGYVPRLLRDAPRLWGREEEQPVYVVPGILIPGAVQAETWYLKVRRLQPRPDEAKYTQVRGSKPALYMADTIGEAPAVALVEGEFDSLLLWQLLQEGVTPVRNMGVATYGSANNHLAGRWVSRLAGRRKVILYDQDEAGRAGAAWWLQHFPDCVAPEWGEDKDLTELYLHYGGGPLGQLLTAAL